MVSLIESVAEMKNVIFFANNREEFGEEAGKNTSVTHREALQLLLGGGCEAETAEEETVNVEVYTQGD